MSNIELEIKDIQFKRGTKAALEAKLIDGELGVPKAGEPIYETDSGKIKIGDGKTSYADLNYFGNDLAQDDGDYFILCGGSATENI
jgi:hypothetical protein